MTIVPGFIDCHNHAGGTTLLYEVLVGNPFEVEFVTIASIIEKLRAKARQTPPGTWVEGYFHDDTKLKDKRPLNVHDLDQVSTEHPVVVQPSRRPHVVLQQQGVRAGEASRRTRRIRRAARSIATRTVSSTAASPISRATRSTASGSGRRSPPEQRAQRERDGIAHISKQFVRYGLTSVHHEGGDLTAIQDVRARGDLHHRVSYEASGRVLDSMIAERHHDAASATSGSSSARRPSTPSTDRSPSARWR